MIQMPLSLSVMGWLPPDSSLSPSNPSSTCTQEVSGITCAASHCFRGLGVSPPEGLIWSRRHSLLLWAVFCTPPPSSRCAVHSDPFTATSVSWSLQASPSPGASGLASPLPIASCDFPGNAPHLLHLMSSMYSCPRAALTRSLTDVDVRVSHGSAGLRVFYFQGQSIPLPLRFPEATCMPPWWPCAQVQSQQRCPSTPTSVCCLPVALVGILVIPRGPCGYSRLLSPLKTIRYIFRVPCAT